MHVPPTEQKRIAAVARQARRLSGLIDSMLDVSKLTGGHLSLELAEVDVDRAGARGGARFTPDAAAAACPLTLRLNQPIVARAGRDPPGSDHHQPDRQRAQVRRRLARRDRRRRRRAGDPADRARPRHRHLARRPASASSFASSAPRTSASTRAPGWASGSRASWSRRWAAASACTAHRARAPPSRSCCRGGRRRSSNAARSAAPADPPVLEV